MTILASSLSVLSGNSNVYDVTVTDVVYVPQNALIFNSGPGAGIAGSIGFTVIDRGEVVGGQNAILAGAAGANVGITIGTTGSVSAWGNALNITATQLNNAGGFLIENDGAINNAGGGNAILVNGRGQINNNGVISGTTGIVQSDTTAGDTIATFNSDTGVIIGGYNGSASTITEGIVNRGQIKGNIVFGSGANNYFYNGPNGLTTLGSLTFGSGAGAIFVNSGGMAPVTFNGAQTHAENFGTITNGVTINGANSYFGNAGRLNGNVTINGAGTVFDSSFGEVLTNSVGQLSVGTITCGAGGMTVIGSTNGCNIIGGSGNDILMANQTQAAADNAAVTLLDGAGGTNALYGGGGVNVFASGAATANQIWGSASRATGMVGSYAGNTVTYANDGGKGVYVDLANGHNAFVRTAAGDWGAGSFALEDSIAATPDGQFSSVPNVIGSSARDIIICDNGVDRITGYGGSDFLYAGTGGSSRDTFAYTSYSDSNLVTGYDSIVGFKEGVDKIDISALHLNVNNILIQATGASSANVYIEQTPGTFNSATDLAIVVNMSAAATLKTSDFII